MIARHGIERIGFVTLTFAENLICRKQAQKRFNSFATNFLRRECVEHIATVERQGRGALHYHLVVAFPYDIRTGFDFEACSGANLARKRGNQGEFYRLQSLYFLSANDNLRAWWKKLGNSRQPGAAQAHGFGRCETLPILSNAQGLARYVGSYIGTEMQNREVRDKGLRTVRYSCSAPYTFSQHPSNGKDAGKTVRISKRVAGIRWQWAEGNGRTWRKGCLVLSAILATEDFEGTLGKRWAWNWRDEISVFGRHWEESLRAVAGMSDHWDTNQRIARASRLAEVLWSYEPKTT